MKTENEEIKSTEGDKQKAEVYTYIDFFNLNPVKPAGKIPELETRKIKQKCTEHLFSEEDILKLSMDITKVSSAR